MAQCQVEQFCGACCLERVGVDLDSHAEVDPAETHHVRETVGGRAAVGGGLDGDDVAAAAADQLVDAQVLEMAAVGEVNVIAEIVRPAEQLAIEQDDCIADHRRASLASPGFEATSRAGR